MIKILSFYLKFSIELQALSGFFTLLFENLIDHKMIAAGLKVNITI